MEFSKKEQEQNAGDNAQQSQLIGDNSNQTNIGQQIVINNNGIPIEEWNNYSTTLTSQVTALAMKQCAQIAEITVKSRIDELNNTFVPRIKNIEGALDNLKDPRYQFMIMDADISAAKSSRPEDIQMLSELLACHIEKGKNMKVDAGIHKAIQIVNEIDYESLCGLTIVVALLNIQPITGNIKEGIFILNNLFSKLLTANLPNGYDWIDHLSVLGSINILSGKFYKIEKLLSDRMDGYFCAGIKAESEEFNQAIAILEKNGLSSSLLIPHECLDGYYRLPIVSKNDMKQEWMPIGDLYSKDAKLLQTAKANFMNIWDSYEVLKKTRIWIEEIPVGFRTNSVGLALAQTNAKRCFPEFPDLI